MTKEKKCPLSWGQCMKSECGFWCNGRCAFVRTCEILDTMKEVI